MKKVVDKHEVAHLFANQLQNEARTSTGNFYFNSNGLFSYGSHFCIAKHVTNATGQRALLFTSRGYSNTTAKHISIARSATSHLNKIFCANPAESIDQNMYSFLKEVENCFRCVEIAKQQRTKLKLFSEIEYIKNKVTVFCDFYAIDIQKNYSKLYEALNTNFDGLDEYRDKAKKLDEAQKKADLKEKLKKHKDQLNKWRNGEVYSLYLHNGFDYLRKEGENLRTSQGVQISLQCAKSLYNNLGPNLIGQKVNDMYEINEVNKDFIKIGCHKITIKEIKKFATSLNW